MDIEIPERLWPKFEEMCPFFHNTEVPAEAVPQHMFDYLERTGRARGNGRKLVGALSAKKILLFAPLLQWYIDHGAQITAVYRTIDYKAAKPFVWVVEEVTTARRTGETDKSKALLADMFKLLGNSAYGKMIEAVERQTNVTYTKDEKTVDRTMRSRGSRGNRQRVRAGKTKGKGDDQSSLPDRKRSVPTRKAADAGILLRLFGQVR